MTKKRQALGTRLPRVVVNNNSPIQDYVHLDDQTQPFEMTPGFKPFTVVFSSKGSPNSRQTHPTVWAAVIFSSVIYVVYKLRCKMITSPLTTTLVSYSYMTDMLIPIQIQSKLSLRPLSFHKRPALVTTNFVKPHLKCDLKTL